MPVGVAVRASEGGCPGFDRTQQLRQARESQVWYVCVRVCAWAVVVALLTQAWLDREAKPARGAQQGRQF